MKRIFLYDLTRLVSRCKNTTPTGIDRVDINYILWLLENFEDIIFINQHECKFKIIDSSKAISILKTAIENWGYKFDLRNKVYQNKYDSILEYINNNYQVIYFNVSHLMTATDEFVKFSTYSNFKSIFFIHDLIPVTHPHFVRENDYLSFTKKIYVIFSCVSQLIVNSYFTKNSINDFCIKNNISVPPIEVLFIGCEKKFELQINKSRLNFFLYVSTLEPRKNHLLLIYIWEMLFQKYRNATPKLLLIGNKGWNIDWLVYYLKANPIAKKFIIHMENISDMQMRKYIYECLATLNPSNVEGWGMPAVESLSANAITICSDIPAYREATKGMATYIHPSDTISWYNTICSIYEGKYSHIKKHFEIPSWKEHFIKLNLILNNFKSNIFLDYNISKNNELSFICLNLAISSQVSYRTFQKIDMTDGYYHGRNWYQSENNGSWFGPNSYGTLIFNNIKRGRYLLSLIISEELINNTINETEIFFNNKKLNYSIESNNNFKTLNIEINLEKEYILIYILIANKNIFSPSQLFKFNEDSRIISFKLESAILKQF